MKMKTKTKTIRRPLWWGLLLAGVAGMLISSTHAVRAETLTSSSVAAAIDGAGSATVKPFFWTEALLYFQQQQLISDDFPTHQTYLVAANSIGIAQPAFRTLSAHALD